MKNVLAYDSQSLCMLPLNHSYDLSQCSARMNCRLVEIMRWFESFSLSSAINFIFAKEEQKSYVSLGIDNNGNVSYKFQVLFRMKYWLSNSDVQQKSWRFWIMQTLEIYHQNVHHEHWTSTVSILCFVSRSNMSIRFVWHCWINRAKSE